MFYWEVLLQCVILMTDSGVVGVSGCIIIQMLGYIFVQLDLTLTHCSREIRKRVIGKPCRPISDTAECGV